MTVSARKAAQNAPTAEMASRFADLGYGPAALQDLAAYLDLLRAWSRKVNLLGPAELNAFWTRHALDCAQLFPMAPADSRWIDLGSGAGLPGLILAIGQKHAGAGEATLVESVGKKAAFMREAARRLGLPATIRDARCEDVPAEPFDVVTARAFAPLPRLFGHAHRFWGPETVGLFPKGKALDEEISAARGDWSFQAARAESITGDGAILRVTDLGPTSPA